LSAALTKARDLIQARIKEIESERSHLEQALTRLVGRGGNGSGRARGRKAAKPARKLAARGERQRQLVAYLEKNPGSRPTGIAKALDVSSANVQNILRRARDEKVITKDGRGYSLTNSGAQKAPAKKSARRRKRSNAG
jgi:predicted transcriptional regulator